MKKEKKKKRINRISRSNKNNHTRWKTIKKINHFAIFRNISWMIISNGNV